MKGINKVSRFYTHIVFDTFRQAMEQRERWVSSSSGSTAIFQLKNDAYWVENTKPQKNEADPWQTRISYNRCGVTTCEAHQRNEISGLACVSRHLLVHWVLADESFIRMRLVVHRNSFFWLICDQLRVSWRRDACKAAEKKEIGARRLRETNEKNLQIFGLERSKSAGIWAFGAIVDARQCRRIFVVSCFDDFFLPAFHGSALKCLGKVFSL